MKKGLRIILLILFLLPICANATVVDFNDHDIGAIQNGDNYDQVTLHDSAIVNMTGGSVYSVLSFNSSTFNLENGNILGWISATDLSIITISGGSVNDLEVYNSAIVSISGGNIIGTMATGPGGTGTVHIYGKNFNINFSGGWLITGYWANDSQFSIDYRSDSTTPMPGSPTSNIFLHTIPEPATMVFLLIGILGTKKIRD